MMMTYILTGMLFTACENEGQPYEHYRKLVGTELLSGDYASLYTVKVNARDWKRLSDIDRFVDIHVAAILPEILKNGTVVVYLVEMQKHVLLPFTYYQVRRATFFQPSYEEGHVYINVLGNFILNVSTVYTFHVLVINEKGLERNKTSDWYNYEKALVTLDLKP